MKILLIILFAASVAFAGDVYRVKCPTCGSTNVTATATIERTAAPLPDTTKEVNRKAVTTTKTFTCSECGNGICTVSKQVLSQRIVDVKADSKATQTWISKHPAPIKPPKIR